MNTIRRRLAARGLSPRSPLSEDGIGLIEIVISLMLLAILAVSLVPILANGLQQAASNATLATATQLANDELERLRTWTMCSELTSGSTSTTDARDVPLTITTTVGAACSVSPENPAAVPVTVIVTRGDTGVVITNTTTYLFISEP